MKIRTDFVTNSSSSSFVLEIVFTLTDDKEISCYGESSEDGDGDFYEAYVRVSPKQLGTAKSIEELVKLLRNGTNISGNKKFISDFIEEIKSGITSMDEIESIKIIGNESNYVDYDREFTYNLKSKEYKGDIWGEEFEKDGSSGGDLIFSDLNECDIWHEGDDDEYDDYGSDESSEYGVNQKLRMEDLPIIIKSSQYSLDARELEQSNKRIEDIKVGDKLVLKPESPKANSYSYTLIEVLNSENQKLGHLSCDDFQGEVKILNSLSEIDAYVESVTPLSARRKNAKYALMDVKLVPKE